MNDMKVSGSSKLVSDKEKQEELVSIAEASDLLPHEDNKVIEGNSGKVDQMKKIAQGVMEKTKPFLDNKKMLADEAIKKARKMSPYVDKTIGSIDVFINYITKSHNVEGRSEVVQETRAPAVFGVWVLIITFGIGMVWSMIAPLDSGSHANGKIILESKKRIIQHPDGGVVKEILVRDGQRVTKGEPLITLDDTELKARHKQYQYKYLSSLAEVSRLISERDGEDKIKFPQELLDNASDHEVEEMMKNQEKFFASRKEAFLSKLSLTEKTTAQYLEQKNALLPQIAAAEKLIQISSDQVDTYKKLHAKGNVNKAYLQDAESRKAENEGRKGQLLSQVAGAEQAILQSQLELENLKHKMLEEISDHLKTAQTELSISSEALKENNERLKRTVIIAPEAGDISNLNENLTPQGVLPAQQILMEVIPQDDKLIVEAKVPAIDIASVKVGQTSRVRLTAYRARIVPVLEGKVVSLSADVTVPDPRDQQAGMNQPYYKIRIEIDKDNLAEVAALKDVRLYPGMGVDVIVVTGTRTLMKYLLDPITLTLDHAFREK